jgi:hypothetical protein
VRRNDDGRRRTRLGQLLDDERVAQIVRPGTTKLFGKRHPKQAELSQLGDELAGEAMLTIYFGRYGRDTCHGELTGHGLDECLLFAKFEVHPGISGAVATMTCSRTCSHSTKSKALELQATSTGSPRELLGTERIAGTDHHEASPTHSHNGPRTTRAHIGGISSTRLAESERR